MPKTIPRSFFALISDSHEGQPSGATSPENRLPWVILHLPHDSTDIPERVRDQFILTDAELARELLLMTDMHTGSLFEGAFVDGHVVRSPVSRLVLDVERFEDDHLEVMSSKGMGAIYTCTSHGHPLRRELSATEKNSLLADFYRPHHKCLTEATVKALKQFDKAFILDAHSFPSKPLPYHFDQNVDRPDICIGTDSFHTPAYLQDAFLSAFSQAGFHVRLNAPYSGALVPSSFYQCDPRVSSIMVEVNRSIYMDESTGERLPTFDAAATRIRDCCRNAILAFD